MRKIIAKAEYGFKPASPLQLRFNRLCETPSSINEHLPILRRYAQSSDIVCELGVDIGQSTTAFLLGQPGRLFSFDLVEKPELQELTALASFTKRCPTHIEAQIGETFWVFQKMDTSKEPAPYCDLLFIDTWHAAIQLEAELHLNHQRVRKWIILHDTESFKEKGEGWQDWEAAGKGPLYGLSAAISYFLREHPDWQQKEHYPHNNGLTVLGRKL